MLPKASRTPSDLAGQRAACTILSIYRAGEVKGIELAAHRACIETREKKSNKHIYTRLNRIFVVICQRPSKFDVSEVLAQT